MKRPPSGGCPLREEKEIIMETTFPAKRMQIAEIARKPVAAMMRLEGSIELAPRLHHLVSLRASQINGCAFCVDMHWKEARVGGETEDRLYSLDVWRESPLYEGHERAALDLCEAVTRVEDGHVPDDIWYRARQHFDDEELAQLVFAITAINAWNRLCIAARVEPGHYRPAMLERAA
jgi:AhpD family alkylhydroperoxidase